jgi:ferrous iron transport protein A
MNKFVVTKYSMKKRLSEVGIGKTVVIASFENDDIFLKLMEMGCVPGETIIVDQVAPLGDPISILVAGYNLSLRLSEANNIWVEEAVTEPKLN